MPINSKLRLQKTKHIAVMMSFHALAADTICYVITSDHPASYEHGKKSHIVYIGTSKNGHWRITNSLSENAEVLLRRHGVNEVYVRIVQCTKRKRLKSWKTLERALIFTFKRYYGEPPIANKVGIGNIESWEKDLGWFNELSLREYLEQFDKKP